MKKLILIIIVGAGLYIGANAVSRVMGLYQQQRTGISREYRLRDKRLTEIDHYDQISVTAARRTRWPSY